MFASNTRVKSLTIDNGQESIALGLIRISCMHASPRLAYWVRALVLIALSLLGTGLVRAQDHIIEQGWYEDLSGDLTWPDVQRVETQAFHGVLSKGFGSSVLWIRLRIDPGKSKLDGLENQPLILRIRPIYLDDIQLFDPMVPGGLAGLTGDIHHPRNQAYEGLDFKLPLARGNIPRDVWLRLQSTSTRQISVQVLNLDDLSRMEHIQQLLVALYMGTILVILAWAVVNWLFNRDRVMGAFALSQFTSLLFAFCALGYSRVFWPEWLPAMWLNMATSFFSITAVTSALLFHVLFIREFSPPRPTAYLLRGLLLLLTVKLSLLMFNQVMRALHLNMLEVLIIPSVLLLSVSFAKGWNESENSQQPPLQRRIVIGFYALLWLVLLIAALPGLAITEGGEIALYIVKAHGLITAILILCMLQYRSHVLRRNQQHMTLALERSQLVAAQEKTMREDQQQLLAMLTHELKTPLATMHMRLDKSSQESHEIIKSIRDMNAVIERCTQSLQLSDQQLKAQLERTDVIKVAKDAVTACAQPERVKFHAPQQLLFTTDPQLFFIVLTNLLENACKYAAPLTPVDLTIETAHTHGQDRLVLWVSNKPGAAGHPDPSKVFEKYYRSPHARRQTGSGLGLFLIHRLAQVLGGRIEYVPDPATVQFRFELPFHISQPDLV